MPYLDHAATTPLAPEVLDAMLPFLREHFGNASSVHKHGRTARHAVENARARIAGAIGAEPGEILFTSGGTEADNLALRGLVGRGDTLITGQTEHEAILRTAGALATAGAAVTFLPPGPLGAVTAEAVARAIEPGTALVSLMHVNNETGAVTDIAAVASVCRECGVWLHTDAVQSPGHLPVDVNALGVDLLSLSAHKINGPKGVGALYVRGGVPLVPTQTGGQQERGRRGGTENVAAIVGFATALERAAAHQPTWAAAMAQQRDALREALRHLLGDAFIITTPPHAAPHILNIAFPPAPYPVDGEMLLLNLDLEGVMASSGSACTSGALHPSHVLSAMGLPRETAATALRFSLGPATTKADVDHAANALHRVAQRMRIV